MLGALRLTGAGTARLAWARVASRVVAGNIDRFELHSLLQRDSRSRAVQAELNERFAKRHHGFPLARFRGELDGPRDAF
jgi:hypothetical protein